MFQKFISKTNFFQNNLSGLNKNSENKRKAGKIIEFKTINKDGDDINSQEKINLNSLPNNSIQKNSLNVKEKNKNNKNQLRFYDNKVRSNSELLNNFKLNPIIDKSSISRKKMRLNSFQKDLEKANNFANQLYYLSSKYKNEKATKVSEKYSLSEQRKDINERIDKCVEVAMEKSKNYYKKCLESFKINDFKTIKNMQLKLQTNDVNRIKRSSNNYMTSWQNKSEKKIISLDKYISKLFYTRNKKIA